MLEVSPDFFDGIDPLLLKISEKVVKQTEARELSVKQIKSIYRALVNKYELTEDELMFANLIFNDCIEMADGYEANVQDVKLSKQDRRRTAPKAIPCTDHLGNHFDCISDMAKHYGMAPRTLLSRLNDRGLTVEEALTKPLITFQQLNDRLSRGWSKEDALNIPWMTWENGND